jgi:hypothetical protein
MPTKAAKISRRGGFVKLECWHTIEFRILYTPESGETLWCYRCNRYTTVIASWRATG